MHLRPFVTDLFFCIKLYFYNETWVKRLPPILTLDFFFKSKLLLMKINVLCSYLIQERQSGDVERYNNIIQHETLRVAVIGMLDNDFEIKIPKQFIEAMEKSFLDFYESYETGATSNMKLNGTQMQVSFFTLIQVPFELNFYDFHSYPLGHLVSLALTLRI